MLQSFFYALVCLHSSPSPAWNLLAIPKVTDKHIVNPDEHETSVQEKVTRSFIR